MFPSTSSPCVFPPVKHTCSVFQVWLKSIYCFILVIIFLLCFTFSCTSSPVIIQISFSCVLLLSFLQFPDLTGLKPKNRISKNVKNKWKLLLFTFMKTTYYQWNITTYYHNEKRITTFKKREGNNQREQKKKTLFKLTHNERWKLHIITKAVKPEETSIKKRLILKLKQWFNYTDTCMLIWLFLDWNSAYSREVVCISVNSNQYFLHSFNEEVYISRQAQKVSSYFCAT